MQGRSYSYQYLQAFQIASFQRSLFKLGDGTIWKRLVGGHAFESLATFAVSIMNSFYFDPLLALDVVNRTIGGHLSGTAEVGSYLGFCSTFHRE